MKNNEKTRKFERKSKNEKRRLVMQKQNARKEKNMVMYGAESGAAVVVGKTVNFNRRFIAAFLALVFVLTTLVGVNFLVKAELDGDEFNMLEKTESGMVLRKGLKYDETSDTYSLKLESYATAPTATKTYDADTPLDVVLVMDQSSTMATSDVWTGDYSETTNTFSIEDADDGNHYYKDGDEYYLVHSATNGYAEVQNQDGSLKTDWTGQAVASYSGNLYYGTSYTPVSTSSVTKYSSRTGSVDMGASYMDHNYFENHHFSLILNNNQQAYVYVPREDGKSCWHAVYYQEDGVLGSGYYYTFYYYTNSVTGSGAPNITSGKNAGDTIGNGNSQITLLCGYRECGCAGSRVGVYWEIDGYTKYWYNNSSYNNGSDGNLYVANGTGTNNYMTAGSYVLACPEPGSTDSHVYRHPLYTDGIQLYYEKNSRRVYFGNSVFKGADPSYTGTLYTKDTMTRLEAEQLGATNLAAQIAAAVTEDADHRIAVVGFNSAGIVESGLVAANANDSDPANDLNDAIDSAISGLTASGSSSVAVGLTKAQEIFANNDLGGTADSRKRIVVLFTDDDTVESAASSEAETLKNTYHASVYTIGYNKDGVSSTVENWLDQLSSNYYGSTVTDDGTDYSSATTNKATILSAFNNIETSMGSLTTTATLGTSNAVLKDIISNNFDATNISTDVKVSTGTWPAGGELSWGGPGSSGLTATQNGNTVSISGFDYNTNYVAEGHNGQKIILTITGLKLKDKAKAESDKRIYTNDATSGIYKTGAEDLLMAKFLRPYVDDISNMAPAGGNGVPNDGVVVNKYLTPNSNGKYDLTLEAYTTVTNQTKVEKVPTDFVVVVDQSGSMSTSDMPSGYTAVSGTKTIEDVAAGSYYIKAADGNYYRVYATRDYLYRYYPANYWFTGDIVDRLGQNLGWFMGETESETTFQNQFYFREVANGNTYYRPITTTIRGVIGTYYMRFSYDSVVSGSTYQFNRDVTTYSSNGNSPWYHNLLNGNVMRSGAVWWAADQATQGLYPDDNNYTYSELATIRTGMYVNYPMYERKVGYNELRYRDINGVEHALASTNGQTSWEFCNANGQALTTADGTTRPAYSGLYQATGTTTRLAALKNALNDFAQAVSEETDSDGKVNNKIAIVGFSSEASDTYYSNTEILTGENLTIQNNNGTQMRNANTSDYATALVSATETDAGTVNGKVTAAINALTANGGTQPEYGLQMANSILSNRSETEYTIKYGSRQGQTVPRNQIVIFFTDGQPGDYPYSDQYAEANQVVEAAYPIKTEQGATVFSIGVFGESDGNPLTYTHARATSVDANWEYLGGWVENYRSSPYYYALRRQWRSGADGYTPTANDTIYDYMSVTSSNYPNATDYIAPGWLNNSFQGTYTDATDGVRGGSTDSTVNNHYRMASNQDTLVAAFAQAVTMMNDTISENVRLDASAILRDILKDGSFVASPSSIVSTSTVNGKMDKNGLVTFDSTATPVALTQTPTYTDGVLSSVDVKGFDYLANYINYGTGTGVDDIHYHEGKKLVVTITDVYPDGANAAPNGDVLVYSNTKDSSSHSSALIGVNNGNETKVQDFPEPAIYRHSYKLNVGDINTSATFDVSTAIVTSTGATIDLTDSDVKEDLKDVMIVFPDGTRYNYLSVGPQVFRNSKDGDTFYFENIPSGYKVKTGVTTTDDSYVYHINFDGGTSKQMNVGVEESTAFTFDNHNINIISDRSLKNVSIWEQTIGDYSVPDQVFEEVVTAQIPVSAGTNIPQQFKYDATLSNDYHGYNNDTLPKNADSYKAVFTWNGENPVDGKVTATLTAIECTKNGTTYTYPTTNGLPMKHDDRITFAMPTGTTVTVAEPETYTHDVSLYTSKDDVAPENITFETMSGTPITGEYEMTFTPVDGIEASSQTVTFEDGVVTSTSNPIDFAPYQLLSFTTDKDIGYPYLNVNGTKIPFDVETSTEGGNTTYTYIAGLKKTTTAAPITTTVEKDNVDILVVNEKGEIPITGIGDSSNHNWIIYILAALGGLAAIGAGIFLWKKRNEFVEE